MTTYRPDTTLKAEIARLGDLDLGQLRDLWRQKSWLSPVGRQHEPDAAVVGVGTAGPDKGRPRSGDPPPPQASWQGL